MIHWFCLIYISRNGKRTPWSHSITVEFVNGLLLPDGIEKSMVDSMWLFGKVWIVICVVSPFNCLCNLAYNYLWQTIFLVSFIIVQKKKKKKISNSLIHSTGAIVKQNWDILFNFIAHIYIHIYRYVQIYIKISSAKTLISRNIIQQ